MRSILVVITLLTLSTSTVQGATAKTKTQKKANMAAPTTFYDPEGVNRPIGLGLAIVVVPSGKTGRAECKFNAGYENAVIIYSDEPTPVELMRCGNISNNNRKTPLQMPAGTYYVTAWHKDAYLGDSDITQHRWTTSKTLVESLNPTGRRVRVEDGTDNDFNDVVVTIPFSPVP